MGCDIFNESPGNPATATCEITSTVLGANLPVGFTAKDSDGGFSAYETVFVTVGLSHTGLPSTCLPEVVSEFVVVQAGTQVGMSV